MALIGIVESAGKIFNAAFSNGECYRISELLNMQDKELNRQFWQIGMNDAARIGEAISDNRADPVAEYRHRIPVPEVHSIRDFYAFEEHVKAGRAMRNLEMIPEWYEFPVFYYSGISSLYADREDVRYPNYSNALDFELELGFIIGRKGINIAKEDAMDHVLGVTIVNDWSARDIQRKEMKLNLGPAKSKDFATSIGPAIMTLDSLMERRESSGNFDIALQAHVNGKKYSESNLNTIYHNIDSMIERASMSTMLYPGDLIMTGTAGTGCILELGAEKYGWIQRNDRVTLTADGIGTLTNRVV